MMNVQISDIVSIITSIGALGTLVLGFIKLYSLQKNENYTRQYNLNMADYEKHRDFILENISEYINLLDVNELSYMALTDGEYEGKDLQIYKKLYSLETLYYRIKLMINPDNKLFEEFSKVLDGSILLAKKVRTENSCAELLNNGLRTPERALEISNYALEFSKKESNKSVRTITTVNKKHNQEEILDSISEAVKSRDVHLRNYLSAAESLIVQKEKLVTVAQKYLIEEKKAVIRIKKGDYTRGYAKDRFAELTEKII